MNEVKIIILPETFRPSAQCRRESSSNQRQKSGAKSEGNEASSEESRGPPDSPDQMSPNCREKECRGRHLEGNFGAGGVKGIL